MNKNKNVLKRIGYPVGGSSFTQSDPKLIEAEFHIARKNKVASLLVQRYLDQFPDAELPPFASDRVEFVDQMKQSHTNLREIVTDDSFALVKSSLPFWIDASDIDILAFDSEGIQQLTEQLQKEGYLISGQSPTAVGAHDPETNIEIDAQTNFSAQHVIYFDSTTLSQGVEQRDVYGTSLPCVSLPRDLALIAVHSITEQMFTLKDYYAAVSILERISKPELSTFHQVVRDNHATPAISAFFSLVYSISKTVFEITPPHYEWFSTEFSIHGHREMARLSTNQYTFPHNYSLSTFLEFCVAKLQNPLFRKTTARQLIQFLDPRTAYYFASKVVERRTRDHYADGYNDS